MISSGAEAEQGEHQRPAPTAGSTFAAFGTGGV